MRTQDKRANHFFKDCRLTSCRTFPQHRFERFAVGLRQLTLHSEFRLQRFELLRENFCTSVRRISSSSAWIVVVCASTHARCTRLGLA